MVLVAIDIVERNIHAVTPHGFENNIGRYSARRVAGCAGNLLVRVCPKSRRSKFMANGKLLGKDRHDGRVTVAVAIQHRIGGGYVRR